MDQPVRSTIGEGVRCTVDWRNGTFTTDEPVWRGGDDTGPDPFTLLLSSLASCTLVTLRSYIDEHELDVPSIAVAVDFFQSRKDGVVSTTIDRDVDFTTPLDPEVEDRLREVAAKCPVSRLLEGDISVRTFARQQSETKEILYAGEDITVVWRPAFCQHSQRCFTQLPQVFDPRERKWITPDGASAERVAEQVARCPSGALDVRWPAAGGR